jgi:hypothetical protein
MQSESKKKKEAKASFLVAAKENASSNASSIRKRGTYLAADWQPNEAGIAYALQRLGGMARVRNEIEKFKNYWTAKSGKDATKVDWDATWRNWILNCAERSNGNGKSAIGEKFDELITRAEALERDRGFGEPAAEAERSVEGGEALDWPMAKHEAD